MIRPYDIQRMVDRGGAVQICLHEWERSAWVITGFGHLSKTDQLIQWAKSAGYDVFDRRPEFQRVEIRKLL